MEQPTLMLTGSGSLKIEMNRFTHNKFIPIPIILQDKKKRERMEELGVDSDFLEILTVTEKFDLSRIECWWPTVEGDADLIKENIINTAFQMQSGESFVCPMDIEKFEELLNSSKHHACRPPLTAANKLI